MGSYRTKNPIPVMLKEDGTYVSRTVPKGVIISVEEMPLNLTQHIIVNWNGKNALMFARDLLTHAERAVDGEGNEKSSASGE